MEIETQITPDAVHQSVVKVLLENFSDPAVAGIRIPRSQAELLADLVLVDIAQQDLGYSGYVGEV